MHAPTVEIFRRWNQKDVAFTDLLRFIRIFSSQPDLVVVSRPGKHMSNTGPNKTLQADEDNSMEVEGGLL